MNEQHRPIADVELERYLLDELPQGDMQNLRQALDRDPDLRLRLADLERSNREVLAKYPPAWMDRRIALRLDQARRAPPRASRSLARYWPVPAAAMVLLVAAFSAVLLPRRGEHLKGLEPGLALFRKTATGTEKLENGSPAAPGDLVQIVYQAAGMKHGAILSVDGRGTVSLHLPPAGDRSAPLPAGSDTVGYAYLLDDAPRFERFYLITADTAFALSGVRAQMARLAGAAGRQELELPAGFRQCVFTLNKEPNHEP
jgi:hypothetical protein